MKAARSIRPLPQRSTAVSRTVLSVVRILIASYFLATATGLILVPDSRTLFDAVLDNQTASVLTTIYLFCTAFLIMVGKLVRFSALLLSVYMFWSGFLQYDQGGDISALTTFWRDMALLGAILLIAVTEPGGSGRFNLFRGKVAPRRIDITAAGRTADRLRPERERLTPGVNRAPVAARTLLDAPEDDVLEDDEGGNIFDDIWDSAFGGHHETPRSA